MTPMNRTDEEPQEPSAPVPTPATRCAGADADKLPLIWIIEDEVLIGRLMQSALEDQGYEVKWFESGEAALEGVEASSGIDILVTDISLPGLSGIEVAGRLSESWPGLPVLVTSGYLSDVISDGMLLPTEYEYLPKPFTPRVLIDRLSRMGHERTV